MYVAQKNINIMPTDISTEILDLENHKYVTKFIQKLDLYRLFFTSNLSNTIFLHRYNYKTCAK